MNGRSHYDVLGVTPTASPSAIRDSYRRLAREFHPDRSMGSAAGADRMPAINEAYRVLSDPGRRAVYDASLRERLRPAPTTRRTNRRIDDDEDAPPTYDFPDGPARIPWRGLLFCSVVAIAGIVVLAQFTDPGEPAAPDNILRTGDCVEILVNGDAKEIACTGSGDIVVRQFIAFDRVCSSGWEAHRDRQGMGVACVERLPEIPT